MEELKNKEANITSKEVFLNDLIFDEVTTEQQIYYLLFKKVEELEVRILQLESK